MFEESPLESGFTDAECSISGVLYQEAQGARRQAQGKEINPKSKI
jgi:hypothetical protein